jgi:hypothetical protein
MDNLNQTIKQKLKFLNNEYVSAAVSLFLVLYAGMAAPNLPNSVARLFDNSLFRLVIFFLIAYMSKKDPTIAIIAAVGLMVSLQTLSKYNVEQHLVNIVKYGSSDNQVNVDDVVSDMEPEQEPEMETQVKKLQNQVVQPTLDESAQVPQCGLKELGQEVSQSDSGSIDYRNQFYPGYVDYDEQHKTREYNQPLVGFGGDGNNILASDSNSSYAPVN